MKLKSVTHSWSAISRVSVTTENISHLEGELEEDEDEGVTGGDITLYLRLWWGKPERENNSRQTFEKIFHALT